MKLKLTIFQRVFFAYLFVGLFTVICTACIHYYYSLKSVENDIRNQTMHAYQRSSGYFEELYKQAIRNDLDLITSTPLLDNYLMSEHNELYLTQPNAEKLFLHFTKTPGTKYLSARFVNSQGREVIITEGNRRVRQYTSLISHPADELHKRVFELYEKLAKAPMDTVLIDGPFNFDNKITFLAGVPKQDPEGGAFGGAVILHCDLTPFLRYLSFIKLRDTSMAMIYSTDDQYLLFPENTPAKNAEHLSREIWYEIDKVLTLGTNDQPFIRLKMRVPISILKVEFETALANSILIGFLIMLIVGISAFLVSMNITMPIKKLVETTRKIASGDMGVKAEVLSQDEIGELSQSFNEMIDSLKESEERLQYEAFHDVLTALPNRALLLDRLERLIERNRRHPEHKFAVLFVDLDRFKNVNDSMGHTKGDELLIAISHRLRSCLRTMDTVARLGGDEFIILMDEINDVADATNLAERILKELGPLFSIDGQEIYVSASIGIAISNRNYTQPADYLRDTDTAMYRAKSLGKARYQVFDSAMHKNAIASLQMETELRSAIEKNEFTVYYQPIMNLRTKKIVRLEALIRWQHPRRGIVSPLEFIPLAEETNLIFPLGRWVLETVCRQIKTWQNEGRQTVPVAFNFSAKQFEQKDLVPMIKEILKDTGITGNDISIEITESIAMHDVSMSIVILNELRALGIKIAIDDFGVGYSSLGSLKLFPIDELKIDRSFIHDVIENPDKAAIAKAIIVMAHSLGYSVTGEGIETKAQLEFLIKQNCDEGQGLYFAPALTRDEVQEKLI